MKTIIIYGKVSITNGYEYLLGYEEGNPCTAGGITILIKSPNIVTDINNLGGEI